MNLIIDDINQVYVWVDGDDETKHLSPHFDYEADAIQWYGRIAEIIFDEFGVEEPPK